MVEYAKVIEDVIVEYPITEEDYNANDRHDEIGVIETTDNVKPVIDPVCQKLVGTPILFMDNVLVNFEAVFFTVDELLVTINAIPNVTIATVPPELLAAVTMVVTKRIQNMLDDFAMTKKYDNINSAISYKTSSVPTFQTEALRCEFLRDSFWSSLNTYLDDIMGGVIPLPTNWSDIEANLPVLEW